MGKRLFDLLASLTGIIVLSPLIITIFCVVKVSSLGPAFYLQERVGRKGKPFMIYKFRTMVVDTEQDGIPRLAEPDDDRLTAVGRFLRSHHLDELPQLWNVLKGDMSIVGPRPERQYFINQIMKHDTRYERLYQLRPGLTSFATLYNGYTDTMEKMLRRLELDLYYLDHQSWWLDTRIICKTILGIISGRKF